jgi:hypothetical protein
MKETGVRCWVLGVGFGSAEMGVYLILCTIHNLKHTSHIVFATLHGEKTKETSSYT